MFSFIVAAPLIELFYRANVRILLWLNHYAAAHPDLYKLALFLTDKGSDLLVLATLLLLWFWPQSENSRALFGEDTLTTRKKSQPRLHDLWAALTSPNVNDPLVTQHQSRAQVLIFGFGGMVAYVIARLIAFELDINRPFASYWMVKSPGSMQGVFEGLRRLGSFPSDHAAMLAGLAAAMFFWNRRLGWFWTITAVVMSICRVAVGFHYPLDMVVGALIGFICIWLPLTLYSKRGALYRGANEVARAFDLSNAPYCYLLYFLVLLAGLEAIKHFEHLLAFLFALRNAMMHSLGR